MLDNQSPILRIQVSHKDGEPDILDYEVGDSLRFFLPEMQLDNDYRRIRARRINIDNQGQAVVTLTIDT